MMIFSINNQKPRIVVSVGSIPLTMVATFGSGAVDESRLTIGLTGDSPSW